MLHLFAAAIGLSFVVLSKGKSQLGAGLCIQDSRERHLSSFEMSMCKRNIVSARNSSRERWRVPHRFWISSPRLERALSPRNADSTPAEAARATDDLAVRPFTKFLIIEDTCCMLKFDDDR